jgi:hypothetical protein
MDEVSCVRAELWADQKIIEALLQAPKNLFTFVDSLKVHPGSPHGEVDLPLWQCCLADVESTTSKCRHGNVDLTIGQCCLADVESTTSKFRHGNVDLTIGRCCLADVESTTSKCRHGNVDLAKLGKVYLANWLRQKLAK